MGLGTTLCVIGAVLSFRWDRRQSDRALLRKINNGSYRIPAAKAPAVLRAIFTPSTELGEHERLARESRRWKALYSRDHTTRHRIDDLPNHPWNDAFAAGEIVALCIGPDGRVGE